MKLQNLHTHSRFCDGADSLEEIVLEAIKNGFDTIGFSSHGYTSFDTSYCMKCGAEREYYAQCMALSEKYRDKINVLCGLELDYFGEPPSERFDYIIGSVHYIKFGSEYIPVDESPEILESAAKRYFGGDMTALCEEYYRLVSDVVRKTGCDIIGHFDLISKFCEQRPRLIDTGSVRYRLAQSNALDSLIKSGRLFEVNTGAMARGYRTLPYPDSFCLKKIHDSGANVILTSDCHKKEQLSFGFDDALKILVSTGFKTVYLYNNGKFEASNL